MYITVDAYTIIIDNDYIVNQGEFNVNTCYFDFSEEYNGLIKKARFVTDNINQEVAIINDECSIPIDILSSEVDTFELRVYAYTLTNNVLKLRYSPTHTNAFLRDGSYQGYDGEGITPTEFEQYEQALHDGLDEVDYRLNQANEVVDGASHVNASVSKTGTITTFSVTNRDNQTSSVQILDGEKGERGDCYFSTFSIINGHLIMNKPRSASQVDFRLNDRGHLEMRFSL